MRHITRNERSYAKRFEPHDGKLAKVKRIARYLKGRPQCVLSLRLAVETASTLTVMVKRVTRLDAHQREVQLLAGY